MRRQIARRARRKLVLKEALIECGLYPDDESSQIALEQLDPYALRARALKERLLPHEIGRVLVHLNQRRGFLSNRKTEREKKKEETKTLQEINTLASEMAGRTLGEHFAEIRQLDLHEQVRGRHTRRDMYQDEFERIWEFQHQFYPELLSQARKHGRLGKRPYPRKPDSRRERQRQSLLAAYGIHGILFFQRAMYWPKSVIGECTLEPKQPRCTRGDRRAQRFRLLQEVNNLRVVDTRGRERMLSPEERTRVIRRLETKKEVKFDELRGLLGLNDRDIFNLERGDRTKLKGMATDLLLAKKEYFGRQWAEFSEPLKNDIVRSLIEDPDTEVFRKAVDEWNCDQELAARLVDVGLEDGYMSVSRLAIEKLLPHLEQGLRYMGKDAHDSALHAAGYLREDEKTIGQRDNLPAPPDDITNPLVRQALHEVRKLVNAIIREWGKPGAIHIELAREVQGGRAQRQAYSKSIRERERQRSDAAEKIREWGAKPTRESIQRYLLWKEQREICLYSGRPVSMNQLLGGEVDIDHLLPYSRSLDDSMQNKVVCFKSENQDKANRTVHEWLADRDPTKYQEILQRAGRLPLAARGSKLRKVAAENVQLDDFLNRQLTDTAYISRQVHEYVRCLGADVVCTKGQSTAELRQQWGLNEVLRTDGLNLKNREDHRHHAVDALVIALTDRSRLQQLARGRYTSKPIDSPWVKFRDEAQRVVDGICVSHRVTRKIHGALHEETIYGPTHKPHRNVGDARPHAKGWVEEEGVHVIRKKVEDLTAQMIEDIRDRHLHELVCHRFDSCGRDLKRFQESLKREPLRMVGSRGAAKSPNANVIKTVRVLRRDRTVQPIRKGTAWVKPGSNHHICLFELPEERAGAARARPQRSDHAGGGGAGETQRADRATRPSGVSPGTLSFLSELGRNGARRSGAYRGCSYSGNVNRAVVRCGSFFTATRGRIGT